jgi:hypothetical protein
MDFTFDWYMAVHGKSMNIYTRVPPDAMMERLLDMAEADVLVCGHTYILYHRILPSER